MNEERKGKRIREPVGTSEISDYEMLVTVVTFKQAI